MKRYLTMGAVALSVSLAALACAEARAWEPRRPVRLVAGASGAVLDITARQIADRIAPSLRQPIVIDNRGGAGGIAMMDTLARALPDGHTVGLATFVEMTVNPWLYERLPYDPARDFAPVTALFTGPQLLVASASSSFTDLPALLRAARSEPGRYFYGSSGVARPPHIFMEKFKLVAGIDLPHVPYRGGPPLMHATMGAEVAVAMEGTPVTVPLVHAGKLRALAVTGPRRLAALPEVPTFAEHGIDGVGLSWVGVFAPRGTPEEAIDRLNKVIRSALQSTEIRQAYALAGRDPVGNSPQDLAAWVRRDLAEWRDVIRRTGMRPD